MRQFTEVLLLAVYTPLFFSFANGLQATHSTVKYGALRKAGAIRSLLDVRQTCATGFSECGAGCCPIGRPCCKDGGCCDAESYCTLTKNGVSACCPNELVCLGPGESSTATSVSSHATSTTTGNGVSSTSIQGKSSTPVGVIVGSVIGGLSLVVFAILGLLLLCRHKRRAAEEKVLSSTPRPFFEYNTLHPSSITPNYSLPLQQSTLIIRKPLLSPLPVSRPSSLPLLSGSEREAEALAASESQRRGNTLPAMVSMQSNATRSPNVIAHQDSGIRMPSSTPATNEIMEVPPLYTAE